MKIISVNPQHTSGPKDVAFNVEGELDSTVLSKIRHPSLRLNIERSVLVISTLWDLDAKQIGAKEIALIEELYAKAEEQVAQESKVVRDKRARMLEAVAETTGLPIGEVQ